jgi:hypothetical protein
MSSSTSTVAAAVLAVAQTSSGMDRIVRGLAPAGSSIVYRSSSDTWTVDPAPKSLGDGRVVFERGGNWRFEPWNGGLCGDRR